MIISHNLVAMNANRQFNIVGKSKSKSTEKLSSGYRINRAADDAAGLAISEKMRRQINGLNKGAENIQDGISLMQVADGALSEVHDMINRMETLAVEAANDTLSKEDRSYLQEEVNSLVSELNRIARNTTFNEIELFDGDYYLEEFKEDIPITKLITSKGAEQGYLKEAYKSGASYYSAAYLDFSNVNESNIYKLNNGNFTFNCSENCNEVFDVSFTTDKTPSSATNLSGKVHHYYSVDISSCKNGKEVVDTIYDYISNHIPNGYSNSSSGAPGGIKVSHSNNLIKEGNKLIVVANGTSYSSQEAAKNAFPKSSAQSGKISYSEINIDEKIPPKSFREFEIQCSSNIGDIEKFKIYRMNGKTLGIDPLDISTVDEAGKSLDKIKKAHANLSNQRAHIGASQNRLEHSFQINKNVEENTSAAESRIRDTDMDKEMLELSMNDILEQAGTSVLSQANQNAGSVLALLQ